jgi:hypothetical protein
LLLAEFERSLIMARTQAAISHGKPELHRSAYSVRSHVAFEP